MVKRYSMQTQIDFTIHPNSLYVYQKNILPTLSERQKEVLNALRYKGPSTCSEIATYLKTFPHTLSGRFTELRKRNLIKELGNRIINNRPHAIWTINNAE